MGGHRMEGIVDVLEVDLPVGPELGAQHPARHAQPPLGRTVGNQVECREQFARTVLERGTPARIGTGEHEAAMNRNFPVRGHAADGLALLETGLLIAGPQGHTQQTAI